MSSPLIQATPQEQLQEVTRAAIDVQVEAELLKKLTKSFEKQKPLVIKAGFDPTAPDLHLGHTVVLQRMKRFQEFGHQIVFIIGGFTATIGDPTGKNSTRPPLSAEQVAENAETYKQQLFKVLDPEKTQVRNNAEWLVPLGASGMIKLAARYTVARMLERADFKKRWEENSPIAVHEFLYPLLQGWDSVAIKADVELGGSDQIFNLLVGRQLMKEESLEPQVVITSPLLEGLSGDEKMSKSHSNYVAIADGPNDMYGKLLSISDDRMWRYYELLSARSSAEIAAAKLLHPKQAKVQLAKEIVARFHDASAADAAELAFEARSKGGTPEDAPTFTFAGKQGVLDLLVNCQLADSKGEAKRLVTQNGFALDGTKVTDLKLELGPGSYVLKAGKIRFAKVTITA